jgi:hypothetical protein
LKTAEGSLKCIKLSEDEKGNEDGRFGIKRVTGQWIKK